MKRLATREKFCDGLRQRFSNHEVSEDRHKDLVLQRTIDVFVDV